MSNLAEQLPVEINRVRKLQDQLKELGKLPNVIVEPQIAMHPAALQGLEAQAQIGLAPAALGAQHVAVLQQCRDAAGGDSKPQFAALHDHMRQARMYRQRRQFPAMRGDAVASVDRVEFAQQLLRLGEGWRRRRRHPVQ